MLTAAILRAGRRPSDQKTYAGAPDSAPDFKGQIGVNSATGSIYLAKGTTDATDWIPAATADGGTVVYNADQDIYQVITISGGAGLENVVIDAFAG